MNLSAPLRKPPSVTRFGGNVHIWRPTPVRKRPINNDASRGSDGPACDNAGENWRGDDDPNQDSDHFERDTHANYLASGYVGTCWIYNTCSLK